MSRSAVSGRAPLWRDRTFGTYWVAQSLSAAGDSFAYLAVPLLVLQATGSVAQMGLLTAVAGAASVVAGIFGGVLVDRYDRRTLMIVADLARLVLYALVPLAWLAGPQVWLLFVVLPICEAAGMLFQVAAVTAVRNLVDRDRITEANGRLQATYAAAAVLGPLLAGVVAARFGPATAIAVNAASFALSAAGLWLIRLRPVQADERATRQRPLAEFLAGARFLWRQPVLRALTVLLSVFIFLTYGFVDVLIYHVTHDLGGSEGTVGTVLGLAALGTVAGALLVAPLRRRRGFGATWIGAHAICGFAVAGVGIATTRAGGHRADRGVPVLPQRRRDLFDVPAPGDHPRSPAGPGHVGVLEHALRPRSGRRCRADLGRRPARRCGGHARGGGGVPAGRGRWPLHPDPPRRRGAGRRAARTTPGPGRRHR